MRSNGRAAARRRSEPQRLFAVRRPNDLETQAAQGLLGDQGVDVVVLGDERAALRRRRRGRPGRARNSAARRSNSERARTGFTSQPSKPASDVCPKARRSNGENRTRLAVARGPRGLRQPVGRLGPQRAIDDDEVGPLRTRSRAARPESSPSARDDLTPGFGQARRDGGRLERRIGDDERPRPLRSGFASPVAARLDGGAFRQGDGEGEDRAAARIVFERQRAAHEADELAGDGEPEAGALEAARVGAVALLEMSKIAARRSAGTPGPVSVTAKRSAALAPLDRDADAAGRGEFHRIAGEVHQHLPQAHAVGAHETRRLGADRGGDLEALALGARREQLDHALDEPHEVDRLDDEAEMAGLDLGEIEDLVDERDQRRPELRIAST